MRDMQEAFLRQSTKHVGIFNYIFAAILSVWILNNSMTVPGQMPTESWILIASFIAYAVIYSVTVRVSRARGRVLVAISYISYTICLILVTLTLGVTKDMYGIFYLLLIPLIEFRHTFRSIGMMLFSVATVGSYLYILQDSDARVSYNMWIDFTAGFVVFLIYIIHTIITISSSEVDQYKQRKKAEEISDKIQSEKQIVEMMYGNVRSLSNTLDVKEIAEKTNEMFGQVVWQKRMVFVSLHPQSPNQFQYYCFEGSVETDEGLNGFEYEFVKRVLRMQDVVYEKNACGFPVWSGERLIGAIIVTDFIEGSMSNDFQLLYMLCDQISPILNNALRYSAKEIESITDGMTKVFNKRYFEQTLGKLMELAPDNLYMIIYDIDHFKKFNDTYGHTFGDKVLIETAHVAQNTLRENDLLARYGGEEFVILIEAPNDEVAGRVAERVRKNVEDNKVYNDNLQREVSVTISMGVGKYKPVWDIPAFINAVDTALYQSKNDGRNRVTMVSEE